MDWNKDPNGALTARIQPRRSVLKQPPSHYRPVLEQTHILTRALSDLVPPLFRSEFDSALLMSWSFPLTNEARRRQEETAENIRNKEIPRGIISLFKPMSLARCPLLGKSHRKYKINADHLSSPGSWSKDLIGRQHSKIHWSFFFLTWKCRGSFTLVLWVLALGM